MRRRVSCYLGAAFLLVAFGCGGDGTNMAADGGGADGGTAGDGGTGKAGTTPAPIVETDLGAVQGIRGEGYQEFLGIPYAKPPVEDLRWRPPQPPQPWSEPVQANETPPRCPQEEFGALSLEGQEDCLYLNVHTPDPRPEDAPVMVWMHGGGFTFGEGLQANGGTAGDVLAKRYGVVVVSMNYRLGAFGFLAHEALATESEHDASGNYGLLDQRTALQWVQSHIADFGGDPDNVTIFGESAGGLSVCTHMVSPRSEGLFHRVMSQSGFCAGGVIPRADARAKGSRLAESLGCDTASDVASCLRDASKSEIKNALPAPPSFVEEMASETLATEWGPSVDGWFLPDEPETLMETGNFTQVPTVIGWTDHEGTLFVMLAERELGRKLNETDYSNGMATLAAGVDLTASELESHYPIDDYANPGAAVADAFGDRQLACPSRRAAQLVSGHAPTWVYHFTYPEGDFPLGTDRDLGAFHSADIQYVFGHAAGDAFTEDEMMLHDLMSGLWTQLARSGDPNGGDLPEWPAYDASGDRHLILDAPADMGTGAEKEDCDFWQAAGL